MASMRFRRWTPTTTLMITRARRWHCYPTVASTCLLSTMTSPNGSACATAFARKDTWSSRQSTARTRCTNTNACVRPTYATLATRAHHLRYYDTHVDSHPSHIISTNMSNPTHHPSLSRLRWTSTASSLTSSCLRWTAPEQSRNYERVDTRALY